MNSPKPVRTKSGSMNASFHLIGFLYKYGTILTILLLIAVFGAMSSSFLQPTNIINILRSISIVTIIATGITISLTVGGFDLSVGSTASIANAFVISMFVWHGLNVPAGIVLTLLVCLAVGVVNSFFIVKFKSSRYADYARHDVRLSRDRFDVYPRGDDIAKYDYA